MCIIVRNQSKIIQIVGFYRYFTITNRGPGIHTHDNKNAVPFIQETAFSNSLIINYAIIYLSNHGATSNSDWGIGTK